jgi:hypothetical protein
MAIIDKDKGYLQHRQVKEGGTGVTAGLRQNRKSWHKVHINCLMTREYQ